MYKLFRGCCCCVPGFLLLLACAKILLQYVMYDDVERLERLHTYNLAMILDVMSFIQSTFGKISVQDFMYSDVFTI